VRSPASPTCSRTWAPSTPARSPPGVPRFFEMPWPTTTARSSPGCVARGSSSSARPTLPRWGCPPRWSRNCSAPLATRGIRSAALLDATSGPDVGDPYWAPPQQRPFLAEVGADPGRLRIGFTDRPWNGHAVDPECVAAVASAARLCEELGHRVEEARPEWDEP